jgi:hypothetical protein
MMGIETIRAMADDAGLAARVEGKVPVRVQPEIEQMRSIPFLGTWVPPEFEEVDRHFVDSSGFGSPGEPALTIDQFMEVVAANPDAYWAIVEAGQFQVFIGQFEEAE